MTDPEGSWKIAGKTRVEMDFGYMLILKAFFSLRQKDAKSGVSSLKRAKNNQTFLPFQILGLGMFGFDHAFGRQSPA